jgi:hypothetical protein
MSAPRPLSAHWPRERTSHWTRDGRFHTGPVEACADCATRPDVRAPATLGSVDRTANLG